MNEYQENTTVQVFSSPAFGEVRALELDGEPWFLGADVAKALGYSTPRKALADHVHDDDKRIVKCDTEDGILETTAVNAPGVHALITCSRSQTAAEFKRWFWKEILPKVRKQIDQEQLMQMLSSPEVLTQLLAKLKETKEVKETKEAKECEGVKEAKEIKEDVQKQAMDLDAAINAQLAAERNPVPTYYDDILSCKEPVPSIQIARDYGWSLDKLNKVLAEQGIQHHCESVWQLEPEYTEQGYARVTSSKIKGRDGHFHTRVDTAWTQKGRVFLYQTLKSAGILPMVERGYTK